MKDKPSKFYVYWIEFKMKDGSIKNSTFTYDFKNKRVIIDTKKAIGKFFYFGDWADLSTGKPRPNVTYRGKFAYRNTKTYAEFIQYELEYDAKIFQQKVDAGLKAIPDAVSAKVRFGRANSKRVPFKSDTRMIEHYRMNIKTRIGFCSNVLREIPNRSQVTSALYS